GRRQSARRHIRWLAAVTDGPRRHDGHDPSFQWPYRNGRHHRHDFSPAGFRRRRSVVLCNVTQSRAHFPHRQYPELGAPRGRRRSERGDRGRVHVRGGRRGRQAAAGTVGQLKDEDRMDAAPQTASGAARSRSLAARLPLWVLIGAFLGVLAGITFGERTAVLQPLGVVYAVMLESVVYPYILSSLIVGLGSLAGARARRLFHASWAVYLGLWVTVLAALVALALAIPPPAPPVEVKQSNAISVLALLQTIVPENLTLAL